jgi:hypothetical protein
VELVPSVYTTGHWESRIEGEKTRTEGNEKSLRLKVIYERILISLRPPLILGFWLGLGKQFVCSESGYIQSERVLKYMVS